jgi:Abnormal spindle-like microcephaly-assoc'd, ASPM-SPD-2-Hydin
VQVTDGNVYGTAARGGKYGLGTVFSQKIFPMVTFVPLSLNFGYQALNETSVVEMVTVTNTGGDMLDISNIRPSANFAVSSTSCGSTLAVGGKCTVSVTFTPPVLGKVTGTLTFTDNAFNNPQQVVALVGYGIEPATLYPTPASYAAQAVGTTSAPKTFTLTNNQTTALSNIVISTTGDCAVSDTGCTTNLAAKSHCTISVTFTPTVLGKRTGQLSVSDDAFNSPQIVALVGYGIEPATLYPTSASYAAQTVGTFSAPKTFTLINHQTVALNKTLVQHGVEFALS